MPSYDPVACNAIDSAMKKNGLDFQSIAQQANLSEEEVEKLCTGKLHASQEQYDAIAHALGMVGDHDHDGVCLAKPVEPPSCEEDCDEEGDDHLAHHHHDSTDAIHLLHRHQHRHNEAVKNGKTIECHHGLNPPGTFTWLKLHNIKQYNADTARFDFAFEESHVKSPPKVSSTCVVVCPVEKAIYDDYASVKPREVDDPNVPKPKDDRPPVFRAYTPVTSTDAAGYISFVIKKQPEVTLKDGQWIRPGLMSNYIHEMEVGQRLGIMGYLQAAPSMVDYDSENYDAVTLIAGGVGITPIFQMIEHSLKSGHSHKTKMLLLYANSTEGDIVMREELDAFARDYPDKLQIVYILSSPPAGWTGETGRIGAELIEKYAPPPRDAIATGLKVKVYVAGPPAMLTALAGPRAGTRWEGFTGQGELTGALKDVGYTAEQVHKF
ncbi:hypothetical protein D9757_008947 [Collybiopsis confluens]|uniref:cytochrome-b5 reductase n=1 Tax=Collybiopsis confluens TaxID=2823264 RepID=A0A8H5HF93_9AGAR|nr:hypothetical protein D9757_008947 [Collybiopsis confluens]